MKRVGEMKRQGGFTLVNSIVLGLMTVGYIVGEVAHFQIGTVSRDMARDIEFGDKSCYLKEDVNANTTEEDRDEICRDLEKENECETYDDPYDNITDPICYWDYSGAGLEYQILAGPIFVVIFTSMAILTGFFADKFSRTKLISFCIMLFSVCGCVMAFAQEYWHLLLLRIGIAAGEAACRPVASSLIADLFDPKTRGVANGIFSWGIYIGYGMTFILGSYAVPADILGYGWRPVFILGCIWGVPISIIVFFFKDIRYVVEDTDNVIIVGERKSLDSVSTKSMSDDGKLKEHDNKADLDDKINATVEHESDENKSQKSLDEPKPEIPEVLANITEAGNDDMDQKELELREKKEARDKYWRNVVIGMTQLPMLLLLLAASTRQLGGYAWSFNSQLFLNEYYDDVNAGIPMAMCSIIGGSFGVFFGGWFSDFAVRKLGLYSRLWILAICLGLATPFAVGVLYVEPPGMFYMLLTYYFFSETWFAILFTVMAEIVPVDVRAIVIGIFLFIMNNIGGNLVIVVAPLADTYGYRTALMIFFPGMVGLSAILFFITSLPLYISSKYNLNMHFLTPVTSLENNN